MVGTTQHIYTIHDLASETGVPGRTIQYWTSMGLLPRPLHRANGRNYSYDHLRRIQKIKVWQEHQITLAELAERIEVLGEKALEVVDPYAGFDGWED